MEIFKTVIFLCMLSSIVKYSSQHRLWLKYYIRSISVETLGGNKRTRDSKSNSQDEIKSTSKGSYMDRTLKCHKRNLHKQMITEWCSWAYET